ncbi:DNA cytosine methyltransferase, partial [Bacteroidota bacterium]
NEENDRRTNSSKGRNGAKDAISRYTGLKESLDNDKFFNGNWEIVDKKASEYNFIDLFAGAGGISVGARNAGLRKIASVEIEPNASNTLRINFPDSHHFEGPIEDLTEKQIDDSLKGKKIHVVFGGPPCQGFSVAGLRNPQDPRNQLFNEYIRIVKHLRPDFVVLENVPGILTMEKGKVYQEIIRQFDYIGYPDMTVRILEAATYGVPQLRTRAIFIANSLEMKNPYPKEIYSRSEYKSIDNAIDDLKNHPRDPSINHEWTRHSTEYEQRIAKVPPGGSLYDTFRDAFKRQHKGVPSMTAKENHGGTHIHYELNRVLSARELARLQTFPDDYFFSGTFKRVYWQVGNAVPCLMAEHIALAIKSRLNLI